MISVEVDEGFVEGIVRDETEKQFKSLELEKVYWTIKDLKHHTGMSEPYIREHILFDPQFPAWREGTHWRMLATEVKVYLENRAKKIMRQQNRGITSRGQSA